MRKINLLFIITKLELGGAQKQLLELLSQINTERYSPFLISGSEGLLVEEARSIKGLRFVKSGFLERPMNLFKDLAALIEITRFIKENKIDIVHTHSSKAGIIGRLAARLAGTKAVVHTVHGWSFNDFQPRISRLFYRWLERVAASFTDKLIVVSYHDNRVGLQNRIGAENKYRLIRYGINFPEFASRDRSILKELGIKDSDAVVGTVSCFKPQKSLADFIRVASRVNQVLPDTKFVIIGDGSGRRQIEAQIRDCNLQDKIILAGWRRDIPRILSSFDVFVLTSLWEGMPISVLEAMASSVPVVVTDTGGVSEVVIEGKTGFLSSPRDIAMLSDRVIALLEDARLRRTFGENALRSLSPDFRRERAAQNTEKLYGELIELKSIHAN